ncbi:MAG TPA: hypothetical protein VNO21_09870 [Polyangiaceae bacterium]|nr:hypothetical protein [Polyangiaceae bacterium]
MRIGAIAIVGFVVGVAWPKLTGVRVGPSAPPEAAAARGTNAPAIAEGAASATGAQGAAGTPSAAVSVAGAGSAAAAQGTATPNATAPEVLVKNGILLGCRTEAGDALKGLACGPIAFDAIAQPRMKRLAQCAAAQGTEGKLGVIFNLDFRSNKTNFAVGRSSTIKDSDGLVACLKSGFDSVSLSALAHEHPSYSLLYNAVFSSPSSGSASASSSARGSNGDATERPAGTASARAAGNPGAVDGAQVVWEIAIVRDRPRTGQVVARLPRGSNVRVGTGQDGWYPIKYGEGFASEGWLYRAAIGK